MTILSFTKMHGAGNDFVIIDNRSGQHRMSAQWAKKLCDRRFGVGCDQLVVLETSKKADVFMRIHNADGSEIAACGNATRCIGWRMMVEHGTDKATVETKAGVLNCRKAGEYQVTVDMGEPKLEWDAIPLSEPRNTEHLGIAEGALMDPVAVNVGNPHMIFFVKDVDFVNMKQAGPKLEKHPLFPEGANISAAQVISPDQVRLKVWERGSGETLACGTAACATVVAGVKRGLLDRHVTVSLPGGDLTIDWSATTNRIEMTGPVAAVFDGQVELGLLL